MTQECLSQQVKNTLSAKQNPQVIEEYLQAEVARGNILGSFTQETAPQSIYTGLVPFPKSTNQGSGGLLPTYLTWKVIV